MSETWGSEEERILLDSVEKWIEKEVRPIARQHDLEDTYPHELVEQMKSMGLFGATIDPQYGGLGLSATTYSMIVERMCKVWMSPSGIFNSHLMMAAAVQRFGTEQQKEYFLPRLASGELRGGLALTEPNAGTDLQAIRMRAVRDGDDYVLNGQKTWITNSLHGGGLAILTKTDPEAQPRHRGMTMFAIETRDANGETLPGLTINKLKKTAYRSIDTCELHFDNFRVPAANLIGGEEGRGFHIAVGGLELGRINIAARGAGLARGALEMAVRYAQERETMGKPICEHQAIQLKMGEMASKVEASSALVAQAARMYDEGVRCDYEAGIAKYFASEAGLFCATEAMRIFGGYSLSVEYDIERFYRDAMLLCIGEGTNEMQRIIISKQLVEKHKI